MGLLTLNFLAILLCFNISISWTQAPPSAINHANDVSAQLASLDSANITWRDPSDSDNSIPLGSNAPITSYTLMLCARLSPSTDCSSTSLSKSVPVSELIRVGINRLRYVYNELSAETLYEVVIRAENSVGLQMSPEFGNGLRFNSSTPDDGRVVNFGFIPTTGAIILTWNLPPLALATSNLNVSFDVTYFSVDDSASTMSMTVGYSPFQLEQGSTVDLGEADSQSYNFQITARYRNPDLLSSQATLTSVRTLANDAPLLTGSEAVVANNIGPNDVLTISWPPPNNTIFLVAYSVSYTTSSAHSRRQMPVVMEVPAGTTSTTLPFTPFLNFTVDVDAVYAPPPDRDRVSIPLLPSTTFITPQRQSSPPLNITAVNESVVEIRLRWSAPSTPNGVIEGYRVIIARLGEVNADMEITIIGANTFTFLSQALDPYTAYTFQVAAINGFGGGEFSPPLTITTDFSVFPPVIASTAIGDSGTPQFNITTDRFNDVYGSVAVYKVVVIRGTRVEPSDIPDSHLAPIGVSQFIYYVAYVGNYRQQRRNIFIIGDNSTTTDGRTIYTNPPPEAGVDYYVFIRLYSDIDPSVFADSELTGALRFGPPRSHGATLGPVTSLLLLTTFSLILLFNALEL